MKKLFDFVDGAYFINLDHRLDKREIFENHFKELGILQYIERFKGYYPPDLGYKMLDNGKYEPIAYGKGCLQSHLGIIKLAKEKNLKNVLIFEDDAKFYLGGGYDPLMIINKAIEQLKTIENWELFYLGADAGTSQVEFNMVGENLIKAVEAICSHAILINSTIFDQILNDGNHQDTIDIYLTTRYSEKYLAYPMCVTQRCGIKNDMGWHNYAGLCEDYWLDKYNKKLNKLF
jgi:glycosyl transferase family 25